METGRHFDESEKEHLLKRLHLASRYDDIETIQHLLDQATYNIDIDGTIKSKYGALKYNEPTALHIACMYGNLISVRLLLDRGANIEAEDKDLQTPLHQASRKSNLEVIHLLLDRGANIEAKDDELQTPLYHALNDEYQRGGAQRMDVAVLLLARGANSNATVKYGRRLLHAVCANNNCLAAQMLIDHDATAINATDDTERTPLHLTCIYGRYQAARVLLNRGATVNSRENNQLTPLHLACSHGHVELARLLLDRQADIEAKTISNWTPLHFACRYDRKEVIILLLQRHANLAAKTSCEYELTPLSMACKYNQLDIVWMLMQHDPLQIFFSGLRRASQTNAIHNNDTSTPPSSKRARPNPPS